MSWCCLVSQCSSLMSGYGSPLGTADLLVPFTSRKPAAKRLCLPISASWNHLADTRHCWKTECPFLEEKESYSYKTGVILLGVPSSGRCCVLSLNVSPTTTVVLSPCWFQPFAFLPDLMLRLLLSCGFAVPVVLVQSLRCLHGLSQTVGSRSPTAHTGSWPSCEA